MRSCSSLKKIRILKKLVYYLYYMTMFGFWKKSNRFFKNIEDYVLWNGIYVNDSIQRIVFIYTKTKLIQKEDIRFVMVSLKRKVFKVYPYLYSIRRLNSQQTMI
jgi:hypothetical protein